MDTAVRCELWSSFNLSRRDEILRCASSKQRLTAIGPLRSAVGESETTESTYTQRGELVSYRVPNWFLASICGLVLFGPSAVSQQQQQGMSEAQQQATL